MLDRRTTRIVFRLMTLIILALVLAVGSLVVMENAELRRVWPPTALRTTLIIIGPIAGIWLMNFTLAVKSFGHRSLLSEMLIGLTPTLVYLGIVLSMMTGIGHTTPCPWWNPFCVAEAIVPTPDLRILAVFLLAATACVGLLLQRERNR